MSRQREGWCPVLVHPPETLGHADDRSVLLAKLFQVTLRALNDENEDVRLWADKALQAMGSEKRELP